ncbi:MAG TPA: amidohydrolase family protein, partial [Candidatus Sulfotelmatobacter sp.]|nr:amidohydrolase family protein [Candidatus Sulfotelmatobacter sp.]
MDDGSFDLVIRGGTLVRPGQAPVAGSLGIRDGKIAAVTDASIRLSGPETIEADGLHIFPGVIEPHAHWDLGNGLEDFTTESRSALLGGVTTVLFFLRRNVPYDAMFAQYKEYGEAHSFIDFGFHAVLLTEEQLAEVDHYVRDLGITSFKYYLTFRGEDAAPMKIKGVDDGFMLDCFLAVARHPQALVIAHCENIEVVQRVRARLKAQGRDDMQAWQASRPVLAEVEGVRRAMLFAEAAGCRLNVLHLTTAAALDETRAFRARYPRVFVEVCHSYLTCNGDAPVPLAAKMRPPLRTSADNEALWRGLADGSIFTVGSDHVPRKLTRKQGSVWASDTGCPGTAMLLPILLSEGHHKRGLPLEQIAALTSHNPAQLYGLPRKGVLEPGADAD